MHILIRFFPHTLIVVYNGSMAREIFAYFEGDDHHFENTDKKRKDFEEGFGPYEYLLGALSGCYYYTLEDIAEERGVTWDAIDIHVTGHKRTEVPTTLEDTTMLLKVSGASDDHAFTLAAEEASKCCSIFQTIGKVSRMHLAILFK